MKTRVQNVIILHLKANKQEGNFLTITEKQNAPRRDFKRTQNVREAAQKWV